MASVSPLVQELQIRWGNHPELRKLGLGFTEANGIERGSKTQLGGRVWDNNTDKDVIPVPVEREEVYEAMLYPEFLPVQISSSSLEAFERLYLDLPRSTSPPISATSPTRSHIFVCTHGTRDCRCGDIGEPLLQALQREVRKRGVGDQITVSRAAHLGGHKWAGNALLYTDGGACDWYGLLRETDAAGLINAALSSNSKPQILWPHWRGRLGLDPAQATEMFVKQEAPSISVQANKQKSRVALGDKVDLVFKTWDGDELKVVGYLGETVMETARRHDIESILATCGGFCECATCHVHLPPIPSAVLPPANPNERSPISIPWTPVLPPMTDEEDEQLEFALGRNGHSRLGCQIPVTVELGEWIKSGGRILLPRY